MKKRIKRLHLLFSIPFGLLISLMCLTGAILVFESELNESFNRQRYFVKEQKQAPIALSAVVASVNDHLAGESEVVAVTIPDSPKKAYQIRLTDQRKNTIFVNPYSGEILEQLPSDHEGFLSKIRRLHRWLMLKGDNINIGKNIVGVTTLSLIAILITGLICWMPRSEKAVKSRTRINVTKGWRRFWYDLHVSGGYSVSMLLLIMALTGLSWSFDWYRSGFYKMFDVDIKQQQTQSRGGGGRGAGQTEPEPINYIAWEAAVDSVKQLYPKSRTITLSDGTIRVNRKNVLGDSGRSDSYSFDKSSGEIVNVTKFEAQTEYSKTRNLIYSLHTGSWGGWVTKILYLVACLVGVSLPLTGYYFAIRRALRRRRKQRQSR